MGSIFYIFNESGGVKLSLERGKARILAKGVKIILSAKGGLI